MVRRFFLVEDDGIEIPPSTQEHAPELNENGEKQVAEIVSIERVNEIDLERVGRNYGKVFDSSEEMEKKFEAEEIRMPISGLEEKQNIQNMQGCNRGNTGKKGVRQMSQEKQENNYRFGFDESEEQKAKILVIGVGGAGSNAVDNMIKSDLQGVDFVAINTDMQALAKCEAKRKLQIGREITRGLGAGGDWTVGKKSAEENLDQIKDLFKDLDMVFIAAGLGGGTGTGAAPVVAQLARAAGVLTVGIVTKPFMFEGAPRNASAEEGLKEMKANVDTLIVIPNDRLLAIIDAKTSFLEAFRKADEVLYQGTKGISDIITRSGFINVDFADARSVMSEAGEAIMGIGEAEGDDKATVAADEAITSPLLDNLSIEGAKSILVNICGSSAMGLMEVQAAVDLIVKRAGGKPRVFFGVVHDDNMGDKISVTVIATGFNRIEGSSKQHTIETIDEILPDEPDDEMEPEEDNRPIEDILIGDDNHGNGFNKGNGFHKKQNGEKKEVREFVMVDSLQDEEPSPDSSMPRFRGNFNPRDRDVPTFLRKRNNDNGFNH